MNKLYTVTIGIPAYNEENNIQNIISDLYKQKQKGYILEKIIIADDGSNDKTRKIVLEMSKKNKKIQLIGNKIRVGKSTRLNQLYRTSTSDIYINFDADMRIFDDNVISEIVNKFKNEKVGLVGGYSLPLRPNTIFEKIVVSWIDVWNEIKLNINSGNNIHNHLGCISAMRKDIYKNINIPDTFIADEDFIYFMVLKMNYKFKFANKAKAYYKPVANLQDFFYQHSRFLTIKNHISDYFGEYVNEHYTVEKKAKYFALALGLIKNPIYLMLGIFLQLFLIFYIKFNQKLHINGLWRVAYSTK